MFRKSDTDIELEKLVKQRKAELDISFNKNFDTQEKTLELFIKAINHSDKNNYNDTRVIWNMAGFINIISLDLKIIGRDLTFAENEWQKRLYARQTSLIIYESFNDIFDLLGKDFKKLFSTKINDCVIEENLISIKNELNQFKYKYIIKLKGIRHNAIGHRDNDILNQFEQINNINWSEFIEIVTIFDSILNNLGQVFQKLMNYGLEEFDELKKNN